MPTPAPVLSRPIASRTNLFHSGLALVHAVVVFVGFSRTYYLKGLFGTRSLSWIFHLHGVVFTAWTLFFVFQTVLVAARQTDVHRRMGWFGAVFAANVVIFGALLIIYSMRLNYSTRAAQMPALLINGTIDLILFCVFFGLALLIRDRPPIHKRLMVLAMLRTIIPAIGRLPIPSNMIGWALLALSLAGLAYDALASRRIYLTNVACILVINICSPLRFIFTEKQTWQRFTCWVAH
jgi:hypothetical protein